MPSSIPKPACADSYFTAYRRALVCDDKHTLYITHEDHFYGKSHPHTLSESLASLSFIPARQYISHFLATEAVTPKAVGS